VNQFNTLMTLEGFDNLFTFPKTHEASVDKDACELRTNRFVNERRSNSGIDPAGQTANGSTSSDLRSNEFNLRIDD
jgi:hypothetical protein